MTVALRQTTRSPRVLRTHLHAYVCRIYAATFRASTGLCIAWPAHPIASPLSAGCSSDQRFAYGFLRIPPHGGHPCRSANTSPCRVCRGLAPPSECALPGAPRKGMRSFASHQSRLGTTSQATELLESACVISSTSFLSTPKFGTLARDWTPWWSRIE